MRWPGRHGSAWLFNVGADIYAWFTAQHAWRSSCARMAAVASEARPDWVLDLGCGPGVSTFELEERLDGAHVVGVDVAPRMLSQARRRQGGRKLAWVRGDAAYLPFRTSSVQACTGHSFLYLVYDRKAVLSEIKRVLEPHGKVVLMEPNATAVTLGHVLNLSRDPRHLVSVSLWRPFSRLHGRFSRPSLAAALNEAAFDDVEIEDVLGGLGLLASATPRA